VVTHGDVVFDLFIVPGVASPGDAGGSNVDGAAVVSLIARVLHLGLCMVFEREENACVVFFDFCRARACEDFDFYEVAFKGGY